MIFGGGEPLMVNGKIIGALGVSGGTAEQDTALAAYGASMLKEVISCACKLKVWYQDIVKEVVARMQLSGTAQSAQHGCVQ